MKRYIITSAIPGAQPHENFLSSLENYAKRMKAQILVIPTGNVSKKKLNLDPLLDKYTKVDTQRNLNSNLILSAMAINPEKVDPVAGLDRLSETDHSVVYSSPKQRLKSVASPGCALPRVLVTPGACTLPLRIKTTKSLIASKDHVIGALVVEVENSKVYHFRHVQANNEGSFIDWGVQYKADGSTSKVEAEAIIPGDWHTTYTDPEVRRNVISICKELKPKYMCLHDFFDGISVNHHIDHKLLTKSILGPERRDLVGELKANATELDELQKHVRNQVVIIKSNHDEFLDRWLEDGKFIDDNENRVIGLELALSKAKGGDPLEYGIRKYNKKLNKVRFLRTDESFKLTSKRIECGQHGHLGSDGARGSVPNLEKAYLRAVIGHRHSPEILRGLIVVGTSSYLKLSYNKGPSSWMQTMCVLYPDGSYQLINVIEGEVRCK
jgi:hypothetical protein